MGIIFISLAGKQDPEPKIMFSYLPIFFIIGILASAVQWAWFWATGIILQNKLPSELKQNTTLFKIFFFYPIIYTPLLLTYFMTTIVYHESVIGRFLIIIPFQLFSIFSMFYCMYFIAKTIKTVELQRYVYFSDYIAEIIMIWFFPIGIWFLQPKINKMITEKTE